MVDRSWIWLFHSKRRSITEQIYFTSHFHQNRYFYTITKLVWIARNILTIMIMKMNVLLNSWSNVLSRMAQCLIPKHKTNWNNLKFVLYHSILINMNDLLLNKKENIDSLRLENCLPQGHELLDVVDVLSFNSRTLSNTNLLVWMWFSCHNKWNHTESHIARTIRPNHTLNTTFDSYDWNTFHFTRVLNLRYNTQHSGLCIAIHMIRFFRCYDSVHTCATFNA